MKRPLALGTCIALSSAAPALAETPYRHADEKIGTVEQIYDGDLLPDDAVATFRNIDRLFPTRSIPTSAKPFPLEPSPLRLGPLDLTIDGKTYDLDDVIALNSITGLLVLKDGKVVTEIYQRGNGPDTRWMSMSVAKSITATLIGAAIRDGAIKGEDSQVVDYVPALKGSAYDGVTVGQILGMNSGVKWDETYTDPASDRRALLKAQIAQVPGGLMKVMAALPRAAEPGMAHKYSTGETQVAGEIVIGATGKSLSDYLSEKIWQPYGMEAEAKWWLDSPNGNEIGGSGLSATLRDFARFGQFFLDGGIAGGTKVVPDGWTERAGQPVSLKDGTPVEYGMMWWPAETDQGKAHKVFAAMGIQGQNVFIDPKERVVIAVNGAQPQPQKMEPVDPMTFFDAVVNAIGKD